MAIDLDQYVDVAERIAQFRLKHPEGSLQPLNLAEPYRIEDIAGQLHIVVVTAAYRTPDDVRPGVGMAYEPFPGKTPYTRGSELQNAETASWGRAIVAVLAADTNRGVASKVEVRNRRAEQQAERERPKTPPIDLESLGQGIDACTSLDCLREIYTGLDQQAPNIAAATKMVARAKARIEEAGAAA